MPPDVPLIVSLSSPLKKIALKECPAYLSRTFFLFWQQIEKTQYSSPEEAIANEEFWYYASQLLMMAGCDWGELTQEDCDRLREDTDQCKSIFFGENPTLVELLPKPAPPPTKRLVKKKIDYVPPPTSGDTEADLVANLIRLDGTVAGAMELRRSFGVGKLQYIIHQYNELSRDPEERIAEYEAEILRKEEERLKKEDFAGYLTFAGLK